MWSSLASMLGTAVLLRSMQPAAASTVIRIRQDNGVPTDLPAGWTSEGCWLDNVGGRSLTGATFTNTTGMTVEGCVAFCVSNDYNLAGVEFAQECYCDNFIENGGAVATLSDCNMACTGNANELCGGPNRLSLFNSTKAPPPQPVTNPGIGQWESLGCFSDSVATRTLTVGEPTTGGVDVESCTSACFNAGFSVAGVEFGSQCFCDSAIQNGGAPVAGTPAQSGCNMVCAGNSSEFCGGPNRLNVYNFTGTLPTTPPPPPAGGGGGGNQGGGGTGGTSVSPVTSGLPTPWEYAGCFVDNVNGRILQFQAPDDNGLTVESCIATCEAQGLNYTLAGLEFSTQCFCGTAVIAGGVESTDPDDCNMACGGKATEACGGPNRISLYSSTKNVTLIPVPTPQKTGLPGNWEYQGCIAEPANGNRVFPWMSQLMNNNSAETCLSLCAEFGYPAAGMEFSFQCFCGDVSDLQANGATNASESDCNQACSGDAFHLCGGGDRLSYYAWTGEPLVTWHTPEVTGQYEFLIGGLVVPLIATVGVNGKVTFLEKWGTGPPNSTGAYELDLSLVDDFDRAWRAMHVKTDVFCSGGVILPDKAGRQLDVGGWSLDSTFGVRLYTPDGSAGVNGTNDWEENVNELSLQVGRWYPGTMVMANGTVLVVGGEIGSNSAPEPSLETLPTPAGGNTTVFLDFLQRTDPNNLYPFLFVVPSGILIIYYNEARILNEATFATIRTLPNLPGEVNNFLAGRTYPLEGTAVLLPQHAPYTDPITVLVCGGSTNGAGIASDNCVSIQPEVSGAQWTIERMPSPRVMTCMVPLPDGTFMIMNGAQQGVAGFGLATNPNLQALLYDPSQPVNQRISILNETIVARLYHSEAVLLPDGRVLVSGSDPEDGVHPQEYRVEVYIPPYLSTGLKQPTFEITETDLAYGSTFQITNVKLFQGQMSGLRVSLVAAVSSTHGNSFGARTIFPAFSCSGTTCTITAPPNAHVSPPAWHQLFILDGPTPSHSVWVRIGGDPASLGNWPTFPDFTHPGV